MEIEPQEEMMAETKFVKGARVWVNGIEIHMVSKFNMAEGWVEAFVTSPDSYSNVDLTGEDWVVSRIFGFVEVKYK